MYSNYKKVIWCGGIIVLIVLIVTYFYFGSKNSNSYKTISVIRTTIEDKVLFSGNVKPAERVTLSFEKTGRIVSLPAYVGKVVYSGEVLATLSSADSIALLDQAKASLMAEEATLADLKRGTRPESIEVAKTKVATAESTLSSGLQGLRDALNEAYTKADDAVHNTLDPLYRNGMSSSPQLLITVANTQLVIDLERLRVKQERTLSLWKSLNDAGYPNLSNPTLLELKAYLAESKTFVDLTASALAMAQSNGNISQTNLDTWRAAVGIARTTLSTSISKLNTSEQAFISNQSALILAKQDLAVLQSGSSVEAIANQEAKVASARAKVSQYQAEVSKGILVSPIDGIVSTKDTELGQIVSANQQIFSVISNRKFQIESNVSELDIGKLKVGMFASTTLDAYGLDTIFPTKIIRIDPAETKIDNSPAYGVELEFLSDDSRIKSGMTANNSVTVERQENVLVVPIRTIKKEEGGMTVQIVGVKNIPETRKVEIGLVSRSGMVLIKSGLKEGDTVILPQGL